MLGSEAPDSESVVARRAKLDSSDPEGSYPTNRTTEIDLFRIQTASKRRRTLPMMWTFEGFDLAPSLKQGHSCSLHPSRMAEVGHQLPKPG